MLFAVSRLLTCSTLLITSSVDRKALILYFFLVKKTLILILSFAKASCFLCNFFLRSFLSLIMCLNPILSPYSSIYPFRQHTDYIWAGCNLNRSIIHHKSNSFRAELLAPLIKELSQIRITLYTLWWSVSIFYMRRTTSNILNSVEKQKVGREKL